MSKGRSNRRRTMIVNKPLQKRIMMSMSLFPVMGLVVAMGVVAVFSHRLALEALQADVEMSNVLPLFLSVSAFVVMSGVFLLYNSLKASHRVAGPAHRICTSLERIRNGDIGFRVTLRDSDFLEEVRDELNLVLEWLNENPPPGVITDSDVTQEEAGSEETQEHTVDSVPPALVTESDEPSDEELGARNTGAGAMTEQDRSSS